MILGADKRFPKVPHIKDAKGDQVFTVYEKLDGANAGIFLGDGGNIYVHSRRRILASINRHEVIPFSEVGSFAGLLDLVRTYYQPTLELLKHAKKNHVYGEWLIPHTLKYPRWMYERFYLFPVNGALEVKSPYNRVPIIGEMSVDDVKAFDFVEFSKKLKRDVEGFVLYEGNDPKYKFVNPKFREDHKVSFGGKRGVDGKFDLELAMASHLPPRTIAKVYEAIEDEYGEFTHKHIWEALRMAREDYYKEFFYDILTIYKPKEVNIRRLNKLLDERVRSAVLSRLEVGMWPAWMGEER